MNWLGVKSVEDLKSLGKFTAVKAEVEKEAGGIINLKLNSWNNLYSSISKFQDMLGNLGVEFNEKAKEQESNIAACSSEEGEYFNCKASEYIFYLLELDGEARLKKLKVTKTHYRNKEKAKLWRNEIIKVIHSDKCHNPKADAATSKLTELYKGMVGDE